MSRNKSFPLPNGGEATVQSSIIPSLRYMVVRDAANNEVATFGSLDDNHVQFNDLKTGRSYVIGKEGYSNGSGDSNMTPFGDDSLGTALRTEKSKYDSLQALTKESGAF